MRSQTILRASTVILSRLEPAHLTGVACCVVVLVAAGVLWGSCLGFLFGVLALVLVCVCLFGVWRSRTQADLDGIKKEFPTATTICVDLRDADKVKVQ